MLESLLAAEKPGPAPSVGEVGTADLWAGLNVADLFAGTGALGIEALSRGAAFCDLFESDASARRVIQRNLEQTGLADRARVFSLDVRRAVAGDSGPASHRPYGVVVMDPPYRDHSIAAVMARLADGTLLADHGLIAVEHAAGVWLDDTYEGGHGEPAIVIGGSRLIRVRLRRHGDTALSIYRLTRPADRGGETDEHHGDLPG